MRRPVLGVDLGTRWASTGSALLRPGPDGRSFRACRLGVLGGAEPGPALLTAAALAARIDALARAEGMAAVGLDGPHAWRDPGSAAPGVGRLSEALARCPGRTGPLGVSRPRTYLPWIRLCIEVFDRLLGLPGVRLADPHAAAAPPPPGGYLVLESFPTATWRASGLLPLPGHARAPPRLVRARARALAAAYRLPPAALTGDHDSLQALVAALVAAAACGLGPGRPVARGAPVRILERPRAHRVEGYIWESALPSPPCARP